jgi:type III restriction enzyme
MKLKFTELDYQVEAVNKTITAIFENPDREEFGVEMETGTGKTYTYIRTIFELYRQQKLSKFIIVAPSIAVREGIKKSFENLSSHLQEKYSRIIYDVYSYNSKKLRNIENFCDKETLQILIIGIHGFNKKDSNILWQNQDGLSGGLFESEKYIDKIASSNPIIIIDEPQMMDAEKSKEAIANLNPKFVLKYSATHKNLKYEPIYKLTPSDAYEKGLVKQVEYYGVYIKDGFGVSAKFIKSEQKGKKWIATILDNGKEKKVKDGDKIGNFTIERVLPNDILFEEGKMSQMKFNENDDFELRREQIKRTIQIHEQKKKRLNEQGIKVLSLFFIDFVPNFEKLRTIFEEELACENPQSKYAGYFSDKSTTKGIENDEEKLELIMKDKERLLSLDEPVEYIFTHSALGVGWDCPNVFQICFLRDIGSDISRRQFIGRGLRLSVNQDGDRIRDEINTSKDEIINLLTVIGGEKWDEFVSNYQEDCKKDGVMAVPIKDGSTPKKIMKIRKEKLDEARVLWKKIARKSKYLVHFNEKEKLYENIINAIKSFEGEISAPKILIEKGKFVNPFEAKLVDADFGDRLKSRYDKQEVIGKICEETWLTKWEVNKILEKCDENAIKRNQQMWLLRAVFAIKEQIQNAIMTIAQVEYQLTDEKWGDKAFYDDEKQTTANTESAEKSLYDLVEYDSAPEKNFIKTADKLLAIKLFMKLPKGGDGKFHINTPIGKYYPDFAVIVGENDKLYMVFEVKDRASHELVQKTEEFKIKCAIKHFRALGFDVETNKNINEQADILRLKKDSFATVDSSDWK